MARLRLDLDQQVFSNFSSPARKMDFGHQGTSDGNVSIAAQRDQIMDQVRQELATANAQELLSVLLLYRT
jgi:hypothetical protein